MARLPAIQYDAALGGEDFPDLYLAWRAPGLPAESGSVRGR